MNQTSKVSNEVGMFDYATDYDWVLAFMVWRLAPDMIGKTPRVGARGYGNHGPALEQL